MTPVGAIPPHSGAGSRGSGGSAVADHVVVGNSNRIGEAFDDEESGAKEQENVEEDGVNTFAGKCYIPVGVSTGRHLSHRVRWR